MYHQFLGDCSIIQLLKASNRNVDVNARDNMGASPLHYACLNGNFKAVKELLNTKGIRIQVSKNNVVWKTFP